MNTTWLLWQTIRNIWYNVVENVINSWEYCFMSGLLIQNNVESLLGISQFKSCEWLQWRNFKYFFCHPHTERKGGHASLVNIYLRSK